MVIQNEEKTPPELVCPPASQHYGHPILHPSRKCIPNTNTKFRNSYQRYMFQLLTDLVVSFPWTTKCRLYKSS